MVRGQIKMCQKVGSDDPIFDIGNCKDKIKISLTYCDCAADVAVAFDFGSIRGAQLETRGAEASLLAGGRENGDEGAAVDEPLLIPAGVVDVKEKRVRLAGHRVHARGAGFPFDA